MSTGKNYFIGAAAGCLGAALLGVLALTSSCTTKEKPKEPPLVGPVYVNVRCFAGNTQMANHVVDQSTITAPSQHGNYWQFTQPDGVRVVTDMRCYVVYPKP